MCASTTLKNGESRRRTFAHPRRSLQLNSRFRQFGASRHNCAAAQQSRFTLIGANSSKNRDYAERRGLCARARAFGATVALKQASALVGDRDDDSTPTSAVSWIVSNKQSVAV